MFTCGVVKCTFCVHTLSVSCSNFHECCFNIKMTRILDNASAMRNHFYCHGICGNKWQYGSSITSKHVTFFVYSFFSCMFYMATLWVECVWNVMAHVQKPDFVFRRKGRVHLNRRGRHFSRLLAVDVCASAVVMLDTPCSEVKWRVLATHSIRQFPLYFPSRASPCAITFRRDSSSYWMDIKRIIKATKYTEEVFVA